MNHKPKITLSMIVKNEEKYLRDCLKSAEGIAEEIVIVDTGSTDGTVRIAEEFGAAVYLFEWVNDFSAARNYALSKSSGKWILYMDADERLAPGSKEEISSITSIDEPAGFRCLVNSVDGRNGKPKYNRYTRLFRSSEKIEFTGRVHEQIDDSLIKNGYSFRNADVEIIHLGYDVPEEELIIKAERNLSILTEEYEKNPSQYNAYQLANTYVILGREEEASGYYIKSAAGENLNPEYKAHAYLNLADYELKRNRLEQALEYLKQGLRNDESNPLLNMLAADVLFRLNKTGEALDYCKAAYESNESINKGKKNSALSITVAPEAALYKGVYYSLLSRRGDRLQYFITELGKKDKSMSGLILKMISGEKLARTEKEEITSKMTDDSIDAILVVIENYRDKKVSLDILLKADDGFRKSAKFMNALGLMYYENGSTAEAVKSFEEAMSLEKKDPASVFYLISVLLGGNMPEKIPDLLLFAEKEFGGIPEFDEKFEVLKAKLSEVFNR